MSSSVGVIDFDLDVVATHVSVHDRPNLLSLQLFPNPASTAVTFSMNENFDRPVSIAVYDILGQRVGLYSLSLFGSTGDFDIDVSSFGASVYMNAIFSGSKVIRGSFVLQR